MGLAEADPAIQEQRVKSRTRRLLGDADQAIELLLKARASNPNLFYIYLWLAGAFGFKGSVLEAKSALAQALKLKPEINSLARLREYFSRSAQ